ERPHARRARLAAAAPPESPFGLATAWIPRAAPPRPRLKNVAAPPPPRAGAALLTAPETGTPERPPTTRGVPVRGPHPSSPGGTGRTSLPPAAMRKGQLD